MINCPVCHRPTEPQPNSTNRPYRHRTEIEDRLCKIYLEMINLRLEERELLNQLKNHAGARPAERKK